MPHKAAVPRWVQTSYKPGDESYRGKYKNRRLYVGRTADRRWYWSVRGPGLFIDSVDTKQTADSPGEAARRAELAAGYEFAGKILSFQPPPAPEISAIMGPSFPRRRPVRVRTHVRRK